MVFKRWLPTIRSRLYCLVLTMFVAALLLQAGYLYERFQSRQAEEFRGNLEMARAVAGTLNMFVQDVLHQELSIGANFTMPQSLPVDQMNRILETNRSEYSAVHSFFWLDPTGRVVASSLGSDVGTDLSSRNYVRKIIAGKRWMVSDLILSRATGEPIFTISRAIRGKEGELLGIVAAGVSADRLGNILSLDLSDDGAITISDSTGVAVYRYPGTKWNWEERDLLKKRPAIRQALEGKELTGIFPSIYTKEERVVTCAPGLFSNWVVCVSRSKSELMEPIRSQTIHLSCLSLLLTGVVFIFTFFLSHGIADPIRRLRDYALALGRGESIQRFDFKGAVELEDLSSSFNAMADEIGNREEALRRSEEKYRELVENANCSITKLDLDGTITFVNEFAQNFFEFTEEEILGRHIVGTIMPETDSAGQNLRALIEDVVRNPDLHARHENENMRKNGDRVWVMWANKALFDEEGRVCGVLGIGTDITARKRAEDALRKSEQEKTAILGSLRDVAVEYLDPEMRVIWTNSATERVFSLTPGDLEGKKCYEAIHGLPEPCPGCTVIKVLQTGEPHDGEIAKADGRTWMVSSNPIKDPSGKVTNVVHAAMNITARKLMEEALRAEISEREQVEAMRRLDEARLEALWHLSQMTDSSTYQTARFALEQLVRLTKSEVGWIGFLDEAEAFLTVHSWQETPGHGSNGRSPVQIEVGRADVFADAIRERRVVVINDYPGPDPGSADFLATNLKVARIMIVPVFENDRIVAIAGVGNKATEYDPSDARQLTLLTDGMWKIIQREKAEKDLRESESLAAMGRAMAAVAHDMKTPLIAIGGFAGLARKRINVGSPVQNLLEIVVKETQRMENMVKSMLDFSRPLELECSKGDMGQLVAECLAIVAPQAKDKKINLCSHLDSDTPIVACLDFMRMKQVLINLLTNAIQASQDGEDVIIQCDTKNENLLINVIDYGCGIPPDKKQEIFSPFYTSKKEGTGLGLAIVKKIVEAHQGHIEISDNPGKGITFRVEIPIDLSSGEYPYEVAS